MNAELLVQPSDLTRTAGDFNTKNQQVQALTQSMLELIRSMNSVWSGDAYNAYNTTFNKLDEDMQQISRMITEHATDLMDIAAKYEETENRNVEAANALPTDVIS